MLPPPAPTLEISVESALMIRSSSSENVSLTNGRPLLHEGDVGGGAADVAADQVALADRLAQPGAGCRARRRSGDHDPKRLRERVAPRYQRGRAVGEVELAREPKRRQLLVELAPA